MDAPPLRSRPPQARLIGLFFASRPHRRALACFWLPLQTASLHPIPRRNLLYGDNHNYFKSIILFVGFLIYVNFL